MTFLKHSEWNKRIERSFLVSLLRSADVFLGWGSRLFLILTQHMDLLSRDFFKSVLQPSVLVLVFFFTSWHRRLSRLRAPSKFLRIYNLPGDLPGAAAPVPEDPQNTWCHRARRTNQPIESLLIILRPFLNALILAESITCCGKLFHRSMTRSEKKKRLKPNEQRLLISHLCLLQAGDVCD